MTAEQIVRRQNAVPFKPYSIMLADGRQLYFEHRDVVSVSEKEDLVTVFELSGVVEVVDLMQVVSLRYGGRMATSVSRS